MEQSPLFLFVITRIFQTRCVEVEASVLVNRLTSRKICSNCGAVYNLVSSPPQRQGICELCNGKLYQRSDDTEETVAERLPVYEEQTAPWYNFTMNVVC